jgi:F0F1-type ATP synthase alpha subunit
MPANIGTFSYFCPQCSDAMFAGKIFREHQSLLAFQLSLRIQQQNLSLTMLPIMELLATDMGLMLRNSTKVASGAL